MTLALFCATALFFFVVGVGAGALYMVSGDDEADATPVAAEAGIVTPQGARNLIEFPHGRGVVAVTLADSATMDLSARLHRVVSQRVAKGEPTSLSHKGRAKLAVAAPALADADQTGPSTTTDSVEASDGTA